MIVENEVVVVVDVIRAFTTAAVLLTRGVHELVCVRDASEAARIYRDRSLAPRLRVGEHRHRPFPDVDLPNSPGATLVADVRGRDVTFFTANGTQSLVAAPPSATVMAMATVNVGATARWISVHRPGATVHIVPSEEHAIEDHACATYLRALLAGGVPDPRRLREGVLAGAAEHYRRWGINESADYWRAFMADVDVCARVDAYPVALVGERGPDHLLRLRIGTPIPTPRERI